MMAGLVTLKMFVVSAVTFAVLDLIWLGYVIKPFNMRHLSEIGRFKSDGQFDLLLAPAFVVYVLMAAAVAIFVMPRLLVDDPKWWAFGLGALMGLIIYGVFDMTNLAILKNYPLSFAIVDMAWGSFAFGTVALVAKTFRD